MERYYLECLHCVAGKAKERGLQQQTYTTCSLKTCRLAWMRLRHADLGLTKGGDSGVRWRLCRMLVDGESNGVVVVGMIVERSA